MTEKPISHPLTRWGRSPANPTKAGYTFDGRYLGDNGTGSAAVPPYHIAGNATAYANWNKVTAVSEITLPIASATTSVPVSITISSAPTPTPAMGSQGVDTTSITVIILRLSSLAGPACSV